MVCWLALRWQVASRSAGISSVRCCGRIGRPPRPGRAYGNFWSIYAAILAKLAMFSRSQAMVQSRAMGLPFSPILLTFSVSAGRTTG